MEEKVFITTSNLKQISSFWKTEEFYDYKSKDILFLWKKSLVTLNKYNEVINNLQNNLQNNVLEFYSISKKDTYTRVYEWISPSYHLNKDCKKLDKSFIWIWIPEIIRKKGKEKIKEYRDWYKKTFSSIEKYRSDIDYIASLENKEKSNELLKFKKKWLEQEDFKEKFEKRWWEIFDEENFDFEIYSNSWIKWFVNYNIDKNSEELDFLITDRKNFLNSLNNIEKYIIELYALNFYYIKKIYNKENKVEYIDYLWENFIKTDFIDFYDLKEYWFDKAYNLLENYNKNFIKKIYEWLFIHINLINWNFENIFWKTLLEKLWFKKCSECFWNKENNIIKDEDPDFIDLKDYF